MIRNLKVLGMALVVVFAMSAMTAAAASAQNGMITSDGPFILTGTEEETGNKFSFPGLPDAECHESHFEGGAINGTNANGTHKTIASGTEEITVSAEYTNCTVGFFPATVEMTSCDYLFTIGETTQEDEYGVEADVTCEDPEDVIHLEVFADAEHKTKLCSITFEEQGPISGLDIIDNGDGTGTLTGTATGIHAFHGAGAGCPEPATTNNATYEVSVDLSGDNASGVATPIGLSHD